MLTLRAKQLPRKMHEPDILDITPTCREWPVNIVVCHRHVNNLAQVSVALLVFSFKLS